MSLNASLIMEATEVSKTYGSGLAKVHALKNVSLSIFRGDFLAIMGASGSGKSTLLNCLAGLDIPDSGEILVQGKRFNPKDSRQLVELRRRTFGFIFQNYQLIPTLTAEENILLPLAISQGEVDGSYFQEIARRLGIDQVLHRKPQELSGGQQQRVACARALITKPKLIFADEPTGALDSKASKDLLEIFRETVTDFGQSLVMVTHDPVAAGYASRVVTMQDGVLAESSLSELADSSL
ncbi:ABC transporter ATP-binding protein [Boudabousia marimammalium]|uniref:ABC transporter domain-containing protein n=1 Tax=Boudabousia marimammalium TaxID=156892 RepID=A0A1Q5PT28_9ACTO|nr:ABC transporter ATP-binding protein [Boudabousia marimammalium]OKL50530.1 hypothetical protein BM477_00735 [Boudabousia marimammalium]